MLLKNLVFDYLQRRKSFDWDIDVNVCDLFNYRGCFWVGFVFDSNNKWLFWSFDIVSIRVWLFGSHMKDEQTKRVRFLKHRPSILLHLRGDGKIQILWYIQFLHKENPSNIVTKGVQTLFSCNVIWGRNFEFWSQKLDKERKVKNRVNLYKKSPLCRIFN